MWSWFCPSVCLSVCQIHGRRGLWQNERMFCPDFYTAAKNVYPSLPTRRMVGGAIPSAWNFGSNWPRWSENTSFLSIFAHSASAVTPSEKSSINANWKSTMRLPVSLRWTSYIAPKLPKGAENRKTAVFHVKLHLYVP